MKLAEGVRASIGCEMLAVILLPAVAVGPQAQEEESRIVWALKARVKTILQESIRLLVSFKRASAVLFPFADANSLEKETRADVDSWSCRKAFKAPDQPVPAGRLFQSYVNVVLLSFIL